jgi:predicted aconitase
MSNFAENVANKILDALSKFYENDKRIKIVSAHISGISYENIGDSGLSFLNDIAKDGKFTVYTTVNPMGADIYNNAFSLSETFIAKQKEIAEIYLRMGAVDSFTCTPYDYFSLPKRGSHVSWAESSAVVYGNSFLKLFTNKESALSALASSILGETIYSDLHIKENRKITLAFKYKDEINELILGLLIYHIGREVEKPFAIKLYEKLSSLEKKASAAALGTISNVSLFSTNIDGKEIKETSEIFKDDLRREYEELNTSEKGEAIILGCPHLNHTEILSLLKRMDGRHFKKDCIIACCREAYRNIIKFCDQSLLNKKRIFFFQNACPIFSPLLKTIGVKNIITNSVKAAHYYKYRGVGVNLKKLEDIIETESE